MAKPSNEVKAFAPIWIADYFADTTHLSRDEHGGYDLLLYNYYRRGGPLPDDDARLASMAKASAAEWRRLRPVLAEFFQVSNGVWSHKRCEKELSLARDRLAAQRARTEAATNARQKGRKSDKRTGVTSNVTLDVTSATTPSSSPPVLATLTQDSRARDAVWAAYPHPPNASRELFDQAWDALGEEIPPVAVLTVACDMYRGWINAETKRRPPNNPPPVCHAANWLREKRWTAYQAKPVDPVLEAGKVDARLAKIPQAWRPIAEKVGGADKHGWLMWDTVGDKATLSDGEPWSIEFESRAALEFAREQGALKRIAAALGAEPEVRAKLREIKSVSSAPSPDPLEIPEFLRRTPGKAA